MITETCAGKLLKLEHVCWPLFTILWLERLRHHGRPFILPTAALTTIKGLSQPNLRRALHQLESCNLILVRRDPPNPPIVRVLD